MSGLFLDSNLGRFMKKQTTKINETRIWVEIMNNDTVKKFIVFLNTNEQLFEKGINSEGVSLKEIGGNDLTDSGYAPSTIERKKRKSGKGGKFSNITLYDTGDFYESHDVKVDPKGFEIIANPNKSTTNLYVEWGTEITGLTEESLQKLIDFVLIRYQIYTKNVIFKR